MLCSKPAAAFRKLNFTHIVISAVLIGMLSTPALSHAIEYTAVAWADAIRRPRSRADSDPLRAEQATAR